MIDLKRQATEIVERYPEGRSRSALLPLLHRAQERDGYLSEDAMVEVASILKLTTAEVRSVATFYSMYHLKPKGRHVISVCHNIACSLKGAEQLIDGIEKHLGIVPGETTSDGVFTLERVECLAFCDRAPMLQVDYDTMHGPVHAHSVETLLSRLEPEPDQFDMFAPEFLPEDS
ncbi:MAG: NADH-quinone oxidoreductase subunit NuoE [Actinomycetota bacterium]